MTKCGMIWEQISGLNDRLMRQTHPSERYYLGNLSRLYCIRFIVLEPCLNDKHVTSDVVEIRQHTNEQLGNTFNWFFNFYKGICAQSYLGELKSRRSAVFCMCCV